MYDTYSLLWACLYLPCIVHFRVDVKITCAALLISCNFFSLFDVHDRLYCACLDISVGHSDADFLARCNALEMTPGQNSLQGEGTGGRITRKTLISVFYILRKRHPRPHKSAGFHAKHIPGFFFAF